MTRNFTGLFLGPWETAMFAWGNMSLDLFSETNENNVTDSQLQDNPVPTGVQVLMYVMYIAISLTAVGGNGIVCYVVLSDSRMRTVTNLFIVNLAVGDILMALLCIPFTFVVNLILGSWPFGAAFCVIFTYAQAVSVFASAYTLIAISVDKYIAIIKPLKPRMTRLQAKLLIFAVWLVALLTPLPTAIVSKLVPKNNTNRYLCTEVWATPVQRYYYSMALMTLQYFLPLIVLVLTYTRIAIVVWGKQTPGEAEDTRDQRLAASKRKMVKMMIIVVSVFTICWLPLNILIVIGDQDPSIWNVQNIKYVWFVCHWLAMSHTSYNPVIYCWMNSKFRTGFRQFYLHLPCIRRSWRRQYGEAYSLKRGSTYTTNTSVRTASLQSSVLNTSSSNSRNNGSKTNPFKVKRTFKSYVPESENYTNECHL
ncbi:RYamide receptor-like [Tachypleus tridentatus]|uniref:RYamide receptor-like n=1 Tax=Tachypleus tridentatus TaxID=6853 RepID=UPI003FD369AA